MHERSPLRDDCPQVLLGVQKKRKFRTVCGWVRFLKTKMNASLSELLCASEI